MKILFAAPPYHTQSTFVPAGIGIVATVAKNAGFDVSILIAEAGEDSLTYHQRVVVEIESKNIKVLAIGGHSLNYPQIEHLISMVKQTEATVVLGGFIVDASPVVVLKNIGADFCVYGEGEYTFLELMQVLENGGDPKMFKVLYTSEMVS